MNASDQTAPESHNDEQDDERSQAQTVAAEAQRQRAASPTDSVKSAGNGDLSDAAQDTVDHMRDMESSGRIDMGAYRGEDNHDDNEDKYGADNKLDPQLKSDGS